MKPDFCLQVLNVFVLKPCSQFCPTRRCAWCVKRPGRRTLWKKRRTSSTSCWWSAPSATRSSTPTVWRYRRPGLGTVKQLNLSRVILSGTVFFCFVFFRKSTVSGHGDIMQVTQMVGLQSLKEIGCETGVYITLNSLFFLMGFRCFYCSSAMPTYLSPTTCLTKQWIWGLKTLWQWLALKGMWKSRAATVSWWREKAASCSEARVAFQFQTFAAPSSCKHEEVLLFSLFLIVNKESLNFWTVGCTTESILQHHFELLEIEKVFLFSSPNYTLNWLTQEMVSSLNDNEHNHHRDRLRYYL